MEADGPDDGAKKREEKPIAQIEVPSVGRVQVTLPRIRGLEERREITRVLIAGGLTALIIVLSLSLGYRLLFYSEPLPQEHLDTYKTTLALLIGVYGTVMGFYFGSARQ